MDYPKLNEYHLKLWNDQACGVCQRGPWTPYPPRGPAPDRLCPTWEHYRRISYSAQGWIQAGRALLEGKLEMEPRFVDYVYACNLCGSCTNSRCVIAGDQVNIIKAWREDLVDLGWGPTNPWKKDAELIEKAGNRFGRNQADRARWAEAMNLPGKADIVFFAGCVASFRSPELAQSTAKVLKAGGVDFAILGENEFCCGNPLEQSGRTKAYEELVKKNVAAFQEAGAKTVVTACGCCYHNLAMEYPKVVGELPFEVVHQVEMLSRLVRDGRIKPGNAPAGRVTYHDPCHLVRMGVKKYDEPRAVIQSIPGIDYVEMEANKRQTWCCGRNPVEQPELSMTTGQYRIQDARAVGAETILTACSFCNWSLKRAARSMNADVKVVSLDQVMAESMGL
ncbi:MAG: (Fe-S)-binding protein [Dehalococcoidia bacterium]